MIIKNVREHEVQFGVGLILEFKKEDKYMSGSDSHRHLYTSGRSFESLKHPEN